MSLARPLLAASTSNPSTRRLIPFEQAFEFDLKGLGRTLKQTVTVSVEGTFTATSIGYGFVPDIHQLTFGPVVDSEGSLSSLKPLPLSQINFVDVLNGANAAFGSRLSAKRAIQDTVARIGIQLNPEVADLALQGAPLDSRTLSRLFRIAGTDSGDVLFRYALFDEGTGRAFQSDPILNTAGLGISNGDRPFRQFTPPIQFEPRTTVSLQIIEISNHVGKLVVALQGYKVLGESGTPTAPSTLARSAVRGRRR